MKKKRTLLILITVLFLATLACDTGNRSPLIYHIVQRGYLIRGKEEPPPQIIIVPNEDADMPAQPTESPQDSEPPIIIVIPANPALANPPTAEEKAPLPDQPVTYTGDMSGVLFSMTVVFQTGEVTGTLEWTDGNSYSNATIEGRIDTATLAVITAYSGVIGDAKYGVETSISGAITGTISVDYSTFAASWVNESGDRGEFTAYR